MRIPAALAGRLSSIPAMLWLVCGFSELVYLAYFVRQFPLLTYYARSTDMGYITGHSVAGFVSFVGLFTALFLLIWMALSTLHGLDRPAGLLFILGAGAVFAATMVFVYPVTAIDIYTYVAQSRIMVLHHQNPIFVAPSWYPGDPISPLTGEWENFGSPYGPIGIVLDAIPTLIARDHLLTNLILLKAIMSLALLADAYLVYLILRRLAPRSALAGAALVAWNPLFLFETCANGHNDALMMLFALLGLYAVIEGDYILGTGVLVASSLVKYATLALLPLVLVYVLSCLAPGKAWIRYLAGSAGLSLLLVAAAYWPFWQGPSTLTRSLLENQLHLESFSSVLASLFPTHVNVNTATSMGRVLFVPVYLFCLYLASRGRSALLGACFIALVCLLALAVTNFKIWYAVWPVLIAAASDRPWIRASGMVLAWGATLSAAMYGYVWVWLGLTQASSFITANALGYLLSFVPALLVGFSLYLRETRTVTGGRETLDRTPARPVIPPSG